MPQSFKYCTRCKETKNELDFNFKYKKLNIRATQCRECQKIMKRNHYLNNKEAYLRKNRLSRPTYKAWFLELKLQLKCEECGENHPATLDFHHINPKNKKSEISSLYGHRYGKSKILEEIKKCKVLCSNCHRKFHWNENRGHHLAA